MKSFLVALGMYATSGTAALADDWHTLKYPEFGCKSVADYDVAATLSQQTGVTGKEIAETSGCVILPVGTEVLPIRKVGSSGALALTLVRYNGNTFRVITVDVSWLRK